MARFQALKFWIVTGGAVAILLVLGAVWLVHESTHKELPPIADGLSFGAASPDPNPQFTRRLRARFPIGSDAHTMSDELEREGFSIDAEQGLAKFEPRNNHLPCLEILRVGWKTDARNRIASLDGYYFSACL